MFSRILRISLIRGTLGDVVARDTQVRQFPNSGADYHTYPCSDDERIHQVEAFVQVLFL